MVVVDSSALIAVLLGEPEKQIFERLIAQERCLVSAVNAHETATVLRIRSGVSAVERLWQFFVDVEIDIVPFDGPQVRAAAVAFDRYGKGIDAKARLNLSDCAAYALAKTRNLPLLFKGDDFVHTDLRPAI